MLQCAFPSQLIVQKLSAGISSCTATSPTSKRRHWAGIYVTPWGIETHKILETQGARADSRPLDCVVEPFGVSMSRFWNH